MHIDDFILAFAIFPAIMLVIMMWYALRVNKRLVAQYADMGLLKRMGWQVPTRRVWQVVALGMALVLFAVTLIDFRFGKEEIEVKQQGVDVIFLLDVSRSMLAQDASPDRLTKAKQAIRDMIASMRGDRVALFVYAGQTQQVVPLTSNYTDLLNVIDELNPRSSRRGGSLAGDAIRDASEAFVDDVKDHKVIVLFTDGEDQESFPVEAARVAYEEKGVRVFTVGIGSTVGSKIPVDDPRVMQRWMSFQGEDVITKLDEQTLKATAIAGEGAYIPLGTSTADMGQVYQQYIASQAGRDLGSVKITQWHARYQWFLLPVFLLLLAELIMQVWPMQKEAV